MTKDNSTGKNKDFYELGKKMFDRLNPQIAHNPKVVGYVAPQRTWVGLTDEELQPIADEYRILFGGWVKDFARAIKAKLKKKNT